MKDSCARKLVEIRQSERGLSKSQLIAPMCTEIAESKRSLDQLSTKIHARFHETKTLQPRREVGTTLRTFAHWLKTAIAPGKKDLPV